MRPARSRTLAPPVLEGQLGRLELHTRRLEVSALLFQCAQLSFVVNGKQPELQKQGPDVVEHALQCLELTLDSFNLLVEFFVPPLWRHLQLQVLHCPRHHDWWTSVA